MKLNEPGLKISERQAFLAGLKHAKLSKALRRDRCIALSSLQKRTLLSASAVSAVEIYLQGAISVPFAPS